MPAFRLPMMTITPNSAIASVTPASTVLCIGPAPGPFVVMRSPSAITVSRDRPLLVLRRYSTDRSVGGRQEAGLFDQLLVPLLFGGDPFGVVVPSHEGGVESAGLHELLPVGRGAHLVEEVDIIGDLILGGLRRHEDAAQHQILDVEAL